MGQNKRMAALQPAYSAGTAALSAVQQGFRSACNARAERATHARVAYPAQKAILPFHPNGKTHVRTRPKGESRIIESAVY